MKDEKQIWVLRFNDGLFYNGYESREIAEDVIESCRENHAFQNGVYLVLEGPYVLREEA